MNDMNEIALELFASMTAPHACKNKCLVILEIVFTLFD